MIEHTFTLIYFKKNYSFCVYFNLIYYFNYSMYAFSCIALDLIYYFSYFIWHFSRIWAHLNVTVITCTLYSNLAQYILNYGTCK